MAGTTAKLLGPAGSLGNPLAMAQQSRQKEPVLLTSEPDQPTVDIAHSLETPVRENSDFQLSGLHVNRNLTATAISTTTTASTSIPTGGNEELGDCGGIRNMQRSPKEVSTLVPKCRNRVRSRTGDWSSTSSDSAEFRAVPSASGPSSLIGSSCREVVQCMSPSYSTDTSGGPLRSSSLGCTPLPSMPNTHAPCSKYNLKGWSRSDSYSLSSPTCLVSTPKNSNGINSGIRNRRRSLSRRRSENNDRSVIQYSYNRSRWKQNRKPIICRPTDVVTWQKATISTRVTSRNRCRKGALREANLARPSSRCSWLLNVCGKFIFHYGGVVLLVVTLFLLDDIASGRCQIHHAQIKHGTQLAAGYREPTATPTIVPKDSSDSYSHSKQVTSSTGEQDAAMSRGHGYFSGKATTAGRASFATGRNTFLETREFAPTSDNDGPALVDLSTGAADYVLECRTNSWPTSATTVRNFVQLISWSQLLIEAFHSCTDSLFRRITILQFLSGSILSRIDDSTWGPTMQSATPNALSVVQQRRPHGTREKDESVLVEEVITTIVDKELKHLHDSGFVDQALYNSSAARALQKHSGEFRRSLERVVDNIFMGIGYGLANVVIVQTPQGLILFDSLGNPAAMQQLMNDWLTSFGGGSDSKPSSVVGIIYSHFHSDHVFGASAVVDPNANVTQIWAHERTAEEIQKLYSIIAGTTYKRSMRQFGTLIPEREGYINAGIGLRLEYDSTQDQAAVVAPTHIWSGDRKAIRLGGEELELILAPGESRDQTVVWIPRLKVLFGADNIYKSLPNIYAIRGTQSRDTLEWVRSLDVMRSLKPHYLVLGHTRTLVGPELISGALTAYRDAIQYIHDQTVRQMNKGLPVDDVVDIVRLPPHLAEHPFLQPYYGTVSWAVRAVFHHYVGWFSGRAEDLQSLGTMERAKKMGQLAGGRAVLLKRSIEALLTGEYQWALELAFNAHMLDPTCRTTITLRATILRLLASKQTSASGRNWYITSALEAEEMLRLMNVNNASTSNRRTNFRRRRHWLGRFLSSDGTRPHQGSSAGRGVVHMFRNILGNYDDTLARDSADHAAMGERKNVEASSESSWRLGSRKPVDRSGFAVAPNSGAEATDELTKGVPSMAQQLESHSGGSVLEGLRLNSNQKNKLIRTLSDIVDIFNFIPVRLRAEMALNTDMVLVFSFTDVQRFACLHVRRGIAYARDYCERPADVTVVTTDNTWRKLLTHEMHPFKAVATGRLKLLGADPRNYLRLWNLMRLIELDVE